MPSICVLYQAISLKTQLHYRKFQFATIKEDYSIPLVLLWDLEL